MSATEPIRTPIEFNGVSECALRFCTGKSHRDLQLEYANGMEGKDLGWGRLDTARLLEVMRLHAAYADLARQTPYVARIQGSNLLSHILHSMDQAAKGSAAPGSLGKPGDRLLVIVGHDTNLSNLAGMLGISWLLDGYQPNDTPQAAHWCLSFGNTVTMR